MNQIKVSTQDLMPIIIESLNLNQEVQFIVVGTSMLPFFKHAQTVVSLIKKDQYKRNDVILFSYQGSYRLHRIAKINNHQITVIGDHLLSKEIITNQEILGAVKAFSTQGRKVFTNSIVYNIKVILWKIVKPIVLRIKRGNYV
jgi:signal peptidase I